MPKILEKTERRLGEHLLLKGERCSGPKCALIRRSYAPGAHGKSRRRGLSEYGQLLQEKQKVRFLYGLDDREIERYSKKAAAKSGLFGSVFWRLLESRLDNVVFRLGLAESRRIARQLVSHGHIQVNGKTVNAPSCQIKKGNVISIKARAAAFLIFSNLDNKLKKYDPPAWLTIDKNKKTGTVIGLPEVGEGEVTADIAKIKEFYSR